VSFITIASELSLPTPKGEGPDVPTTKAAPRL
jgi:hypothetical protein